MLYFASTALLADGWADGVVFTVDAEGVIASIAVGQACPTEAERLPGPVVPGMPDLHSHAFQRAMAGLTEFRGHPRDSFWTWRELMYRYASRLTPEQMYAIAHWLYIELLKGGYTSVAEFHYLHHAAGGRPYADRAEMSNRLVGAASAAGIGLTLLPVLYCHGGFGGQPASEAQARFLHGMDDYGQLLAGLVSAHGRSARVRIGLAFHSLRAVDPRQLAQGAALIAQLDPSAPVHIHIAEQQAEVDACLAWSGQRPVAWLYDHAAVDERWCLVHATHVDAREMAQIAASRAVAGICPATEANLGDGFFPARAYFEQAGDARFGLGSDSHISVDVADELRLFEYGQRLLHRQRAVLACATQPSVGRRLYEAAAAGGAGALGQPVGVLAPGRRADWLVLDGAHPFLAGRRGDALLDGWIFVAGREAVRDVMVAGRWRIREGRHAEEARARAAFVAATAQLLAD